MDKYTVEQFWQDVFLKAYEKPGATIESSAQEADNAKAAIEERFPQDND